MSSTPIIALQLICWKVCISPSSRCYLPQVDEKRRKELAEEEALACEEKDDADTAAAAAKLIARRRVQNAPAAAASMLTPFTACAVTVPPAPSTRLMQAIFEDSSGSDAAPDWDEAEPKPGASGTAAKGRGIAPPVWLVVRLFAISVFRFSGHS